MAIKVIPNRPESVVDDKVVVRHLVARGSELVRILLEAGGLIEGISPTKTDASGITIEKTIYFNRPDSLDEGVVNRYVEEFGGIVKKLEEVSVSLTSCISPFRSPEGVH
ncbi:MAG: hypothetical protein AAB584_00275 [Patescibacteria group bacterium]